MFHCAYKCSRSFTETIFKGLQKRFFKEPIVYVNVYIEYTECLLSMIENSLKVVLKCVMYFYDVLHLFSIPRYVCKI